MSDADSIDQMLIDRAAEMLAGRSDDDRETALRVITYVFKNALAIMRGKPDDCPPMPPEWTNHDTLVGYITACTYAAGHARKTTSTGETFAFAMPYEPSAGELMMANAIAQIITGRSDEMIAAWEAADEDTQDDAFIGSVQAVAACMRDQLDTIAANQ